MADQTEGCNSKGITSSTSNMSFYRVGQNRRKRAPQRKRPQWDDSVNDLTVYRATPEEIHLRKEAHQSKNHISVKLEKMRKERQKAKLTGAEAQQLAIMKEVLYDQRQLQNVLAKSDTMMAVVKDLFGDDPKRFMGFPNVTTAPHSELDPNRSGSLVASVPDIYTRTEKLSDSVMDQSALNDIMSSDSDDDEVERPDPISYEPKMNLQRFEEYLQEEEKRTAHMDPPSLVSMLNKNQSNKNDASKPADSARQNVPDTNTEPSGKNPAQMMQFLSSVLNQSNQSQQSQDEARTVQDTRMIAALMAAMAANNPNLHTPQRNQQVPLPSDKTPPSAINDTKKVKKTKKCTKSPSVRSDSSANTSANMNDMRKVLQELENEIAAYERQTGRHQHEDEQRTETFSGYTIALVTAVSRLTRYLKETDLRVRTEVTLREQLTEDVYQLRTIIDALATDIIVTQEEYGKLYSEYHRYREKTQTDIASLNYQMRELRQMVTGKQSRSSSQNSTDHQPQEQQQKQHQQQQQLQESMDTNNTTRKSEESRTSTPLQSQQDTSTQSGSGSYQPLPTQLKTSQVAAVTSSAAAILLSPPVRKTRVNTNANASVNNKTNAGTKVSQRQTSLVDLTNLTRENSSRSTDPPHLTQVPPVMNTVSVPRPIPLVQSNVSIPLTSAPSVSQSMGYTMTSEQRSHAPAAVIDSRPGQIGDLSDLVKLGNQTEQQLNQLQEMAVEEAMNNPAMQNLMQTQIAELNRQQEEARRRLKDLLDSQKIQTKRLQDQYGGDMSSDNDFSPIRGDGTHQGHSQQPGPRSVSPPISPISQRPEKPAPRNNDHLPSQGRGITVSLPMVDLDVSGGSLG